LADIDSIYSDIKTRACILIIGPDLLVKGGVGGFFENFIEHLKDDKLKNPQDWEDINTDLNTLYDEDGFFNIRDDVWESPKILKELKTLCDRYAEEYEELYKKIAQIPFHLTFLVTPDINIPRIFKKLNIEHVFCSYNYALSTANEDNWKIGNLDKDHPPVIISLFTQYDAESHKINDVVWSYGDFITFISHFYSKNPLPGNVLRAIADAQQFIFLGHRFDKWYGKIICDLFNFPTPDLAKDRKLSKRNVAILNKTPIDFYTRQYRTKFEPLDTEEFIKQLYLRFDKTELRKIEAEPAATQTPKNVAQEILKLCKQPGLGNAIKKLEDLEKLYPLGHDISGSIIAIMGEYNDEISNYINGSERSRGIEVDASTRLPAEKVQNFRNRIISLMTKVLQD
jgi:hypothetical protein